MILTAELCHPDEAISASQAVLPEASNASLFRHPDDPSIARGGRTSDSFARAKPVPVSENRAALKFCFLKPAAIATNSVAYGHDSDRWNGLLAAVPVLS
jgi:hypothetical protein